VSNIFRALRHRNFRLFFFGQALSLTGMWLQMVGQSWLMYRLTDQALAVALVALAQQGPGLFVGPVAGALADRHSRQRILILAQAAVIVPSLGLGWLAFADTIVPWQIFVLALASGLARAFEIPTRQAFVPQLVEREDIPNAVALNSVIFNAARLVGPAVGGILIATVGEAWCFFANAILLFPVLAALAAIHVAPHGGVGVRGRGSLMGEIAAAIRYVRGEPIVWSLLGGMAVASVAGMPYTVLLPSFAAEILDRGPEAFGVLTAAAGIGAILSALALAARRHARGLDAWLVVSGLIFAVGLAGLSRTTSLDLAVVALAVVGAGFMTLMAATNTLLQLRVPDALRGRVMSFHTALFLGLFPFGGLAAGALADRIGVAPVIFSGSVVVGIGMLSLGSVLLRHRCAWEEPSETFEAQPETSRAPDTSSSDSAS